MKSTSAILFAAIAALLPTAALSATISAGNPIIYRVGTGAATLANTATAVFLDEYNAATGALVQSIPLASTGTGAMTAVGNAGTEGIMTLSQDGSTLNFAGYRKDAGSTNPSSDTSAVTNRVLGSLSPGGSPNLANALTDSTGTIRSVTAAGATGAMYVGTTAGVRYVATPGAAATSAIIDTRNSRQVVLSGNTLFATNGSTTITAKLQSYGALPTTTTAATAIVTLATADALNGFVVLDLNSGVVGDDTIYALSTVGNALIKYSYDGSAWTAAGSISASGAQNLAGYYDGSGAKLFLTSASTLFTFSDAAGSAGSLAGTLTTLATAGSNTGFRGVGAFEPVIIPEPSSGMLLGLMLACFGLSRRR